MPGVALRLRLGLLVPPLSIRNGPSIAPSTDGDRLASIDLEGPVKSLSVKVIANGAGSTAVRITGVTGPDLSGPRLETANGQNVATA